MGIAPPQIDQKSDKSQSEGDSDIRAQFFAQLASSLTEKENKSSAATSGRIPSARS